MQTWITDYDIYKSAQNLDNKRLQANIYESIHILSSLLGVNDKLVNPKRDVSNHPASKLWLGYELELCDYIHMHMKEWHRRGYKAKINKENFIIINNEITYNYKKQYTPRWVTDELIQTHRSVLIQKENGKRNSIIEKRRKLEIERINMTDKEYKEKDIKYFKEIKKYMHYKQLWANTTYNLKMRYDWRNE